MQHQQPLGTRRCCDVESTSLTLIKRRDNVVCPVGRATPGKYKTICKCWAVVKRPSNRPITNSAFDVWYLPSLWEMLYDPHPLYTSSRPMVFSCWASIADGGPTWDQHLGQRFVFLVPLLHTWAGALGQWLAPLPFTPEFGVRFPVSAVWKKQKMFLPHPRVKVSIVGSLRDREVACSASDRQGLNFESCVWRTVSSQSSHHPQEVLLAQFSLYVHKGGLNPIHFISFHYIHAFDTKIYTVLRKLASRNNYWDIRFLFTRMNEWLVLTTV